VQKNVKPAGNIQAYNSFIIAQLFTEYTTCGCDPGVRRGLFCLFSGQRQMLRNVIASSGTELKTVRVTRLKLVRVTKLKLVRVAYID